jgi:hypothetical protein
MGCSFRLHTFSRGEIVADGYLLMSLPSIINDRPNVLVTMEKVKILSKKQQKTTRIRLAMREFPNPMACMDLSVSAVILSLNPRSSSKSPSTTHASKIKPQDIPMCCHLLPRYFQIPDCRAHASHGAKRRSLIYCSPYLRGVHIVSGRHNLVRGLVRSQTGQDDAKTSRDVARLLGEGCYRNCSSNCGGCTCMR